MNFIDFKNLLLQQYKDSENLNKILEIFFDEIKILELLFLDLKNILEINNQFGSTLDLIGDIVGQKRNGLSDEDFKKELKFAIFKNTSRSFLDDIVKILKFITNGDVIIYTDNPPASYTIFTNGSTIVQNLGKIIDKLSASGVSVLVYCSGGEIPFIAKNISSENLDLVDDSENQFIDDSSNSITVDRSTVDDNLQNIFKGGNFGYIEILFLTSNNEEVIITDTGAEIGILSPDQNIVDSAKANFLM